MGFLSDRKLSDDMLDNVTGGTEIVSENMKCPVDGCSVTYSRTVKYNGLNTPLYICRQCNREYSTAQINGYENLKIDYTTVGSANAMFC